MENTVKISVMLKIDKKDVQVLEAELEALFEMVSFRIVPDTQELYEKSSAFKSLVKKRKRIQEEIDIFINEYG